MKDVVLFSHNYEMEVPFFDVDMLEIVWHGHYIKYFEMARCDMLKVIGYNYLDMRNDGFAWPIVDVRVKFIKPARFGQKLLIQCDLIEYENRLKIKYTVLDAIDKSKLTEGFTTQLAVEISKQVASFVTPARWQQKIKDIIA